METNISYLKENNVPSIFSSLSAGQKFRSQKSIFEKVLIKRWYIGPLALPQAFPKSKGDSTAGKQGRKTMENREKPWKTVENRGKPWKTVENRRKPWKPVKNHGKP
jgi:hypothetical protein